MSVGQTLRSIRKEDFYNQKNDNRSSLNNIIVPQTFNHVNTFIDNFPKQRQLIVFER